MDWRTQPLGYGRGLGAGHGTWGKLNRYNRVVGHVKVLGKTWDGNIGRDVSQAFALGFGGARTWDMVDLKNPIARIRDRKGK